MTDPPTGMPTATHTVPPFDGSWTGSPTGTHTVPPTMSSSPSTSPTVPITPSPSLGPTASESSTVLNLTAIAPGPVPAAPGAALGVGEETAGDSTVFVIAGVAGLAVVGMAVHYAHKKHKIANHKGATRSESASGYNIVALDGDNETEADQKRLAVLDNAIIVEKLDTICVGMQLGEHTRHPAAHSYVNTS